MEERVYPQGIACFAKHEKAPDFIGGDIIIDLVKFREWVNGPGSKYLTEYKGSKQLKLQFLLGKDGGRPSVQVNTYKPGKPDPEITETNEECPF